MIDLSESSIWICETINNVNRCDIFSGNWLYLILPTSAIGIAWLIVFTYKFYMIFHIGEGRDLPA